MRIVIAGSSGLIGTAAAAALRRGGHQVTRLVRTEAHRADELLWNPPAGIIPEGALDGVDAVINLCGAGIGDERWTEARKQILRDSRITPTDVLATAVAEHKIPVLINASGVNYYGDTGDQEITEDHPVGTGFLAKLCKDWEAATEPAREAGARVVLLRTGSVLASGGGLLGALRPLFSLMLGAKLGSGTQYMSWISLTDHLRAIDFTLHTDAVAGPVNLTGPAPVTNAEFTTALGEALHRPTPWVAPRFLLNVAIGEFAREALLTGQRAMPKVLQDNGFEFTHQSVRAALAIAIGE